MRAFIQCNKEGLPYNPNVFNAYQGFKEMGFECIFFTEYEELDGQPFVHTDWVTGLTDDDVKLAKRLLLQ